MFVGLVVTLAPGPPSKFRPGDEVELVGTKDRPVKLCADEAIFTDYISKTRKFVLGEEIFSPMGFSIRARVLAAKGDRLQVKILEGHLKDETGWTSPDEVRLRPTPEEARKDVDEGIALTERREIYAEEQGIGELAEDEGFHQIPAIQTDANLLTAHESHVKCDAIIADLEKRSSDAHRKV